jgi:hypothetical protein
MSIPEEKYLLGLSLSGFDPSRTSLWWWLWWRLPKCQVNRLGLKIRDAKARADAEDNFRKTISQLLGGAAVLVGAVLAYLQFTQHWRYRRLTQHLLPGGLLGLTRTGLSPVGLHQLWLAPSRMPTSLATAQGGRHRSSEHPYPSTKA